MAENPEEVWFYSQAGQQHGPVPFSELQARVNELHPVNDMVWKEGMANWMPVGQMRDIFTPNSKLEAVPSPHSHPTPLAPSEAVATPAANAQPSPQAVAVPTPTAATTAVPQTSPADDPKGVQAPRADDPKGVQAHNPKPKPKQAIDEPAIKKDARKKIPEAELEGANRLHYFLGVILFPFVLMTILIVAAPFLGKSIASMTALLGTLLIFIVSITVTLKRFSNLAMTRWWFLGLLIPIVNLWLYYRLFACPGGYAVGRKMDGRGILLALLYWLSLIGLVAFLVFATLNAFTMMAEDPQMREDISRMLIQLRNYLESH